MRRNVATGLVDQIEVVGMEEALLQADVDAVAERGTNASDRLPGKARVRIVEERTRENGFDRNAGDTGTAADKALKAVVVTEVEQAVDHEAERVRIAVQVGVTGKGTGAIGVAGNTRAREATRLDEIGRAHVGTTVTHAKPVFRILLEK